MYSPTLSVRLVAEFQEKASAKNGGTKRRKRKSSKHNMSLDSKGISVLYHISGDILSRLICKKSFLCTLASSFLSPSELRKEIQPRILRGSFLDFKPVQPWSTTRTARPQETPRRGKVKKKKETTSKEAVVHDHLNELR